MMQKLGQKRILIYPNLESKGKGYACETCGKKEKTTVRKSGRKNSKRGGFLFNREKYWSIRRPDNTSDFRGDTG